MIPTIIRIQYDPAKDKRWIVNHEPFYMPYKVELENGVSFKGTLGVKETLNFYADGEDRTTIKIRFYKNGRFSCEIIKESEQLFYRKKYFKTPIDGFLHLIPGNTMANTVIFFRDIELQRKMNIANVDRIIAKANGSFSINDTKWRIKEPLITHKMLNKKSFCNIISNGEIYLQDDGIHIDFNAYSEPISKELRYVIIIAHNHEGYNNDGMSCMYIDDGMFTNELLSEILHKRRNIMYTGCETLYPLDYDTSIDSSFIKFKIEDHNIYTIEKYYDMPKIDLDIANETAYVMTKDTFIDMIHHECIHGIRFGRDFQ